MKRNLLSTMVFVLLLAYTTIGVGIRIASGPTVPVIYVNPVTTNTKKGSDFTVNIDIANVTVENSVNGVYSWEFSMSFNPDLLYATSAMEGPWLMSGGDTLPYFSIDNDLGTIAANNVLYEYPETGVFGSGTLANVTFHVLDEGTCPLDLSNTVLRRKPPMYTIPHTVADGSVNAAQGHDVAVVSITAPSKAPVGDNVPINVTVMNQGSFSETGYVTLYYNTTAIGSEGFTLASDAPPTIASFTWSTTGLTPGNYTLNATASIWPTVDDDPKDNSKIEPFILAEHDIGVTNIDVPKKVTIEKTVSINVTVKNLGIFTEAFNLTVFYYTTLIGFDDTVELPAGDSSILSFSWNTSGLTPGAYYIKANATILDSLQNPSGIDRDPTDNIMIEIISLMLVDDIVPVAITAEALAVDSNVLVKVKVENKGSFVEYANVSLWTYVEVNATVADSKNVTLPLLANTTVALTWDTTDLEFGTYLIYAKATILPSPQNPDGDNSWSFDDILYRTVYVPPIPCDVTGDGTVDNSDLSEFAEAYGSKDGITGPGQPGPDPNWNERCDNNWVGDNVHRAPDYNSLLGKVDVLDLFNLSKNYGKTS